MYEVFYGLNSKPFQINPDPSFYFGSKQHRRAKAYLEYGVLRNEGFIVITGEVGAGKTTMVRGLIAGLDASKVVAANLVTTQLDAEDILRMVGSAFGVWVKDISKADVLMALEAFFLNQTSQGKRCLLIVDEAQNLSTRAVEELRMLSNFQYDQQALLQTFLVGQPEFRAILQSPGMKQLRQRVTATCHIGPLDQDETRAYIEHRLKCAGSTGRPTFDAPAVEKIFKSSDGIPRRINLICDRLLLLGFLGTKDAFGLEDVTEVVDEIQDESGLPATQVHADSALWSDSVLQDFNPAESINLDPGKLQVTPALARSISSQVDALGIEQFDARLRRLEGSALRLERINLETLVMMQKLVKAITKVPEGKPT
jgi:putative secretion ATPase (PEP-CTERM system associated)